MRSQTGKLLIVLSAALLSSVSAFAGSQDSGCGLGSVVISRNSKLLQLFSMTTNGTFSSQALGITFGTSNCSSSGIVMNEKQVEYFVEVNHQDLHREVAQGHGEKLDALAQMHGCQSQESKAAFSAMAQKSYPSIFASSTPHDIVVNLQKSASQDQNVIGLCQPRT